MLEESFGELMSQDTGMVILDYNEVRSLERVQQALNASERLAGIVGTFQPGLPDIPFISLEELFRTRAGTGVEPVNARSVQR